jgi:hypothetical protein
LDFVFAFGCALQRLGRVARAVVAAAKSVRVDVAAAFV